MIVHSKLSPAQMREFEGRFMRARVDVRRWFDTPSHIRRAILPSWLSPAQVRYLTGRIFLTASGTPIPGSGLPIVPGAFGFGMETRAAYGGASDPVIVRVRNLNDSGSESLRAALEGDGLPPRVVIPEVSGHITLSRDIVVTSPYVTLAGQTAPSPGLTVKGFGIQWYTHDFLQWHMRIRPGDGPPLIDSRADHDASIMYGANCYNGVFANNSFSWAQGKNLDMLSLASGANISLWRNISAEALYHAANVTVIPGGPSSLGLLIAQNYVDVPANVSAIGNLIAHCSDRNPEVQGPVSLHWINNVVYDHGKDPSGSGYPWGLFLYWSNPPGPTGTSQVAAISNKYIAGPPTAPFGAVPSLVFCGVWNVPAGTQLYLSDNAIDQAQQAMAAYFQQGAVDPRVGSSPVSLTGIQIRPSSGIEADVLGWAGARPADRDSVDTRIVAEVTGRTGDVRRSQNEVGGWSTQVINNRALSTPSSPHAVQASGYTALEEWIQEWAAKVERP